MFQPQPGTLYTVLVTGPENSQERLFFTAPNRATATEIAKALLTAVPQLAGGAVAPGQEVVVSHARRTFSEPEAVNYIVASPAPHNHLLLGAGKNGEGRSL